MISAAAAASGADLLDRPYTESLAGNWPPAVSASAAVYVVINAQVSADRRNMSSTRASHPRTPVETSHTVCQMSLTLALKSRLDNTAIFRDAT